MDLNVHNICVSFQRVPCDYIVCRLFYVCLFIISQRRMSDGCFLFFFCILSETDICIFIDTDAPCDLGWLDCGWFRIFALLYIRGARVTSV